MRETFQKLFEEKDASGVFSEGDLSFTGLNFGAKTTQAKDMGSMNLGSLYH